MLRTSKNCWSRINSHAAMIRRNERIINLNRTSRKARKMQDKAFALFVLKHSA